MALKPASSSIPQPTPIRFSRTLRLNHAIAIGSSVTLGVGIFLLLGLLLPQDTTLLMQSYLGAVLLFAPLVLTYAERAAVLAGSGGIYNLVRASGSSWRTYGAGWLLLGGNLVLMGLLGWGAALYLDIGLRRFLGVWVDLTWLAPAMVLLVALNDALGTLGRWRLRRTIIYGTMLLLLAASVRSWFLPPLPEPPTDISTEFGLFGTLALLAASLWGVQLVLDGRDEMPRPNQTVLPALFYPLLVVGVLGALLAVSELRFLGFVPSYLATLPDLPSYTNLSGTVLLEVGYITLGFLTCMIALDRASMVLLRLLGTMSNDGFVPERIVSLSRSFGTPLIALRFAMLAAALAAAFLPVLTLIGLAALLLLWTTALLNLPDALHLESPLPAQRRVHLPLHPLFPALASAISLFLPIALSGAVLLSGVAWVLVGALYYVSYARQGRIAARRRAALVGETPLPARKEEYIVLVGVANPETAPDLIRAASIIARARGGRVLALKIVLFPDQVPQHLQRMAAQTELNEVNTYVRRAHIEDIQVQPLVRLAHNPIDGILSASEEERADLILLGWEAQTLQFEEGLDPLLDPIIRAATCDVIVLHGRLPDQITSVLVPTAGSPNTLAAVRFAQQHLTGSAQGQIVALNLVQGNYTLSGVEQNRQRLKTMLDNFSADPPVELRVSLAEDIKEGILNEAEPFDVLLLGASRGGILDQAIFGGMPVELAAESPSPAMLFKHYEGAPRFWLRRAWEVISSPFPSPTTSERTAIYQDMRRAAHPDIDFFVMIVLSSVIATLGLLLGSPAVIIGAMLVAPLMSPILAMAMSVVHGNPRMLRSAASSALVGMVLSISVGILITLIAPTRVNTGEILSRTQPNLLDLLVALASGMAGGYAMGNKQVAAALPGVAIAVALVPPLGVVGYGIATAQLDIAGGALLLFTTNLVAIIFAAAGVFLLLGFRPPQSDLRPLVQMKFLAAAVAVAVIAVPLTMISLNTMERVSSSNQIETLLTSAVPTHEAHITDIVVEQRSERIIVHATIYTLDHFDARRTEEIETALRTALGKPVELRATILRALALPDAET